ncbi:unnamed protein product [Sympodiomycopsis kandeliae]
MSHSRSSRSPGSEGGSSSSASSSEVTSAQTSRQSSSPPWESKALDLGQEGFDSETEPEEWFTSEYDETFPALPKQPAISKLAIDAGTPDAWIERDERMIRLTGKHPYNCEAPLDALWKAGWLTPQALFYVRTHGATPRVSQQQAQGWKLRIHGLVQRPMEFSVEDLKRLFPTVSVPVTLVCAGNRRKEQNMVMKGLGFNWGAAGVSNGIFTGVYLADVLEYCKPIRPIGAFPYGRDVPGRARHVIFEGIDELPKGKYGTSQRLTWAKDRSKSMLLAWGLNGEPLSPDHGFPLRLVVPGQIGGRMVKWLNRIEVSDQESQHFLHFKDNKVLPAGVSADEARSEEGEHWWKDPKYIINELNTNAAITVPNHNDKLKADPEDVLATTKISGYAYAGGGRRVHRVELSLDDGQTWDKPATLLYPEDTYRERPIKNHPYFGTLDLSETEMSFSWCFWEMEVTIHRLRNSPTSSLTLRATDEALGTMPDRLIWNAYGMMNNCHFRVGIHHEEDGSLMFEHPTVAGTNPGGWMARVGDPRYPVFKESEATRADAPQKKKERIDVQALMEDPSKRDIVVTAEQLKAHSNEENPWFVVNGQVYDGTGFLKEHPGGGESITLVAGEDASEDFMAIHSADAKRQLAGFHVGRLAEGALQAVDSVEVDDTKPAVYLNPKSWKKAKLIQRTDVSHDSRILRFALDHPSQLLGLPIGQHVYMRTHGRSADGESEIVQRAYTPFSGNELVGFLDILIKVYFPTPNFPGGGRMTSLLEKMKLGDSIELKGPLGGFTFLGKSQVRWKGVQRKVRKLALICGGSGITPIWSTIKGLMECADSTETECWLLNGNRTEADILAKSHIEDLQVRFRSHGRRFEILNVLSGKGVEESWQGGIRGRVTKEVMQRFLPPAPPKRTCEQDDLEDTLALVCGPPAMESAVRENLEELGWDVPNTVVFF